MRRADSHIDDPEFILDLPHHNTQLPRMSRHPMKHTGRRAHRISAIETDAGSGPAHCQCLVPLEKSQRLSAIGERKRKRLEMGGGVVVARARYAHVFGDDGLSLSFELKGENIF